MNKQIKKKIFLVKNKHFRNFVENRVDYELPAREFCAFSTGSTEFIHCGGLILFFVRFFDIFKKHPNILLDRTPTNKYSDDGENDNDIKISSLSNAYEQMY